MISLSSLAAFQSSGATNSVAGTPGSRFAGAPTGLVERVRAQSAAAPATTQGLPKALPSDAGKILPRGSLLDRHA